MKKVLFKRVSYPSEKTPDGKFIRSPSFESAVNRAVQLSLLRINKIAGITIQELKVLVVSKLVYPMLKAIDDDGQTSWIKNNSDKMVELTTRKLSELYKSLLPDNAFRKGTQTKDDSITKTFMEIKKVLDDDDARYAQFTEDMVEIMLDLSENKSLTEEDQKRLSYYNNTYPNYYNKMLDDEQFKDTNTGKTLRQMLTN